MSTILIFLLIVFFIIKIYKKIINRDNSNSDIKYREYKSSAEILGEIGEDRIARFLNSLSSDYYLSLIHI